MRSIKFASIRFCARNLTHPVFQTCAMRQETRIALWLKSELLEESLRHEPEAAHDESPEEGHVDDLGFALPRLVDEIGGTLRRDGEKCGFASPCHARVDRAELDCCDAHRSAREAPPQSLGEQCESALCRAIDVISPPPPPT